jgi:hypothetical protein
VVYEYIGHREDSSRITYLMTNYAGFPFIYCFDASVMETYYVKSMTLCLGPNGLRQAVGE